MDHYSESLMSLISKNLERIVTNINSELKKPILKINYWNFFHDLKNPNDGAPMSLIPTKIIMKVLFGFLGAYPQGYFPQLDDAVNLYKLFVCVPLLVNSETNRESEAAIRPTTSMGTRNHILEKLCHMTVSSEIDSTKIDRWIKTTLTAFERYSIRVLHEKIPLKNDEFWCMIKKCFYYLTTPSNTANRPESTLQFAIENIAFQPCLMISNFITGSEYTVESGVTRGIQSEVPANLRPDLWVKDKDRGLLFMEVKLPELKPFLEGEKRVENTKLLGYIRQMISYCLALSLHKSVLSDGRSLYLTFYRKRLNLYSSDVISDIDKVSKLITIDEIYSRNPTFDDKITANMIICLLIFEGRDQGSQTLVTKKDAIRFNDVESDRLSNSDGSSSAGPSAGTSAGPSAGPSAGFSGISTFGNSTSGFTTKATRSRGNAQTLETPPTSSDQSGQSSTDSWWNIKELPTFKIDKQHKFEIISDGGLQHANVVRLSMMKFIEMFGLPFNYSKHEQYSENVVLKIYDLNDTEVYVLEHPEDIDFLAYNHGHGIDPIKYYYENVIDQQYIPELKANLKVQDYNLSFPERKFYSPALLSYGLLKQRKGYLGYFLAFNEIKDFEAKRPKTLNDISKGIEQLEILHSQIGITHGDIANRNIAYDETSGEFSIIDFNSSKVYNKVDDVDPLEMENDLRSMKYLLKGEQC